MQYLDMIRRPYSLYYIKIFFKNYLLSYVTAIQILNALKSANTKIMSHYKLKYLKVKQNFEIY